MDRGLPRSLAATPAAGAGWSADLRGLAHLLFPCEAGSRLGPAEFLRDLGTAGTAGELGRPGACLDGPFLSTFGFLLAYAYLDSSGRPKTTDWTFWRGRFVRLYPLYFLSLLLLVPAPALLPFTAKHSTTAEVAGGVLSSLTLTQAWFPAFALWWNAPAWALSAFAAFYAIFPAFSRWTAGLGQRGLMGLVIALTLLSWVPAGALHASEPRGRWLDRDLDHARRALADGLAGSTGPAPEPGFPSFWRVSHWGECLACGSIAARSSQGEGQDSGRRPATPWRVGILCLLAFARQVPYVPLRHGLLAPFSLVVINDLAHGRGLLARFLSWRGFGRLSEASFSLFALQMPAGVWFCVATLSSATGTTAHLRRDDRLDAWPGCGLGRNLRNVP